MDKNTIYGLLLMLGVMLLFWGLQPKDTDGQTSDNTPNTEKVAEQPAQELRADSLTTTEREWLVKNVADNGKPVVLADGRHAVEIDENGLNLTLVGDSIFGTVKVDGREIKYADIVSANTAALNLQEQRKAIALIRSASLSMGKYGKFAKFLAGTNQTIKMQNDVLDLELSSKSGSITRAELKKYYTEYDPDESKKVHKNVVMFEGKSNTMAFDLPLPSPISTSELYFTPHVLNDTTILMALDIADDAYWGIEYTLPKGDSYVVKMRIVQKNMASIVQSNNRNLGIDWHQDLHRQEKGRMFEERNSALYYKFAGGSVEHLNENKDDSEERQNKLKWIGFKNQFFSTVLIADRPIQSADFESRVLKGSDYLKSLTTKAIVNDYDWQASSPARFDLFIGPNLYPLLSSLDKKIDTEENLKLTKVIPLGWSIFRWINTLIIIPLFDFLGTFISNYGIIILILTIFIKLVLFPFTYKSYKSQAKMRVLAPDIKAINDKYPGNENAMLRQQKTMALYNKAGASPMSGCLPMLLQMPILFAMFSFFPSCIELRGQSFLWAHDLSAPDAIISWSGHIPFITDYFGNHISLFCLLMTITNIIYTHINMQSQQGNTMPGMKWMMYLMPVFFLVFFNNYAAGLSYYYFLSLLITIIQTYAFRYFIKEEDVRKAMAENAKKPKKKSGFMARLEQMQKEQQKILAEQQRQQQRGGGAKKR